MVAAGLSTPPHAFAVPVRTRPYQAPLPPGALASLRGAVAWLRCRQGHGDLGVGITALPCTEPVALDGHLISLDSLFPLSA